MISPGIYLVIPRHFDVLAKQFAVSANLIPNDKCNNDCTKMVMQILLNSIFRWGSLPHRLCACSIFGIAEKKD
ncbi:hypothetical protein B4923_01065 [Brenneria roseae subsp. americana]|uniref:Uncharacterized protein n=1 Tax=Brenneria roseae subsp. americana TaxID=1508507 RepID=A0A2U1U235_9GAMM|nr:hypothetical protein B4923_01065 [Brenneria roseae subsp. americana]